MCGDTAVLPRPVVSLSLSVAGVVLPPKLRCRNLYCAHGHCHCPNLMLPKHEDLRDVGQLISAWI